MGLALTLVMIKTLWSNSLFMDSFIIIYRLFNAFAKIGVFAIAMQCCSKNVSASQFTLYMTFGATGSIAGAALIGPIKDHFSWEISFLFFVGFLTVAWLILKNLDIDQQISKINDLEKKHVEGDFSKIG